MAAAGVFWGVCFRLNLRVVFWMTFCIILAEMDGIWEPLGTLSMPFGALVLFCWMALPLVR